MKPITNLKQISQGRSDIHQVDPRLIVDIEGLNERRDFGDIGTLKEQIRIHGVTTPLRTKLEDGRLGLVKGYRRMRCVRELIAEKKWTHGTVPIEAEPRGAKEQDRLIDQIVGNEGKTYTLLEQGRVFERLVSLGMDKPAIAEQTGKTRTHVANALRLVTAPPAVLKLVEQDKISGSVVLELMHDATTDGKLDNEKLVASVNDAIGTAADRGKAKASRKDTGKRSRGNATRPEQDGGSRESKEPADGAATDAIGEISAEEEDVAEQCVALIRRDKPELVSAQFFAEALKLDTARAERMMLILRSRAVIGEDDNGVSRVLLSTVPATTHATDWTSVRDVSPPGGGGSGGGGADRTSYDTSTNLKKLNNLLEDLAPEKDSIDPKCWDTIECIIDFLEGRRTTKDVRAFIKA